MMNTTVYLDLETGGVEDHHPNIQLAAVAVQGWQEVAEFEAKIAFDVDKCAADALKVNGYKPEVWAGAKPEKAVMHAFDEWLESFRDLSLVARNGRPYTMARLAGFNCVRFDIPRMQQAMDRAGVGFWRGCWWYPLDVMQRALWYFAERPGTKPENFKLQTLAKHFGLDGDGAAHDALADARLCVKLARVLTTNMETN